MAIHIIMVMNDIYFKQLVGSRFFGTNLDHSDTDIFIIHNGLTKNKVGKIHYMYHSIDDGLNCILGITPNFYQLIDGLNKIEVNNTFTNYLNSNIEQIKNKNIGISYNIFADIVNYNRGINNKKYYENIPRRYIHLLLYEKIFIEYSKNLNLHQSVVINDDFKQFIQAARERKISYNEISKEENTLCQQFNQLKNFYNNKIDKEFAYKEKEKMKQIINNIIVEQQYQEDK